MEWSLYILDCGGRYYTGIAKNPAQRFSEHASRSSRAARFTRAFPPRTIAYQVAIGSRSLALRTEMALKKLSRPQKTSLIGAALQRDELLQLLGIVDQ